MHKVSCPYVLVILLKNQFNPHFSHVKLKVVICMTTWFLFLSCGLFFAWIMLWIGTSMANDPTSPLTWATGLRHKDFSQNAPYWNEIQTQYGKSLQKAGAISFGIMIIGMICLFRMEQELMIFLCNCLFVVEILLFLLAYFHNYKQLQQKLQTYLSHDQIDAKQNEIAKQSRDTFQEDGTKSDPSDHVFSNIP